MANLCFNTVRLFGSHDSLQVILDKYNMIPADKTKDLEHLQSYIGFTCSDWGRSCDKGITYIAFAPDDPECLEIQCTTAWNPVDLYWDALVSYLGLSSWASWCELDSEIYVINDPAGEVFPTTHKISLFVPVAGYAADTYYVESEDEALNLTVNIINTFVNEQKSKGVDVETPSIDDIEDAIDYFWESDLGEITIVDRE